MNKIAFSYSKYSIELIDKKEKKIFLEKLEVLKIRNDLEVNLGARLNEFIL